MVGSWLFFFFPIPLTILLVRDKTMNPKVKYGIIAGMWIILLILGLVRNTNDSTNNQNMNNQVSTNETNLEKNGSNNNNYFYFGIYSFDSTVFYLIQYK